jgi:hypothetical protein
MRVVRPCLTLCAVVIACVHTPSRSFEGRTVGWGEVLGDPEGTALMREAAAELIHAGDAGEPELLLHVEATTSGRDEPVLSPSGSLPQLPMTPMTYRRVQRMRATLRLVTRDGAAVAEGTYEETETGPDRPPNAQATDDLGVILSRRIVRTFLEQHGY